MNILILWTDEQRFDTLACYGNEAIGMPNLNRLAEDSTVFERAYCTAPVCTPSRGSVMTGQWAHRHGATKNNRPMKEEALTLPEMCGFHEQSAYVGKWHLGDEIYAQHGWKDWVQVDDTYIPWYSEGRDRSDRCDYHHWLVSKGVEPDQDTKHGKVFGRSFVADLAEHLSKPRFQADRAIEAMEKYRDDPWIMSVNLLEPHMPFKGPRNDMYDPWELPVSPNFMVEPDESCVNRTRQLNSVQSSRGAAGHNPADEGSIRECMARYWGLCSQVDHYFGRIIDHLHRKGMYDDTLIVFTSDHGDMMGSHQLIAKTVMFEESARIPLLVKLPGQRDKKVVETPVSHIDLIPTLLEAAGEALPEHLDGQSLLPCWKGEEPDRDVLVFWYEDGGQSISAEERNRVGSMEEIRCLVTTDRWKLVASKEEEFELYDLNSDPYELKNLAPLAEHGDRLLSLRERLASLLEEAGDPELEAGSFRV